MCALPKVRVKAGQDPETKLLNIIQCCPETPVLGGKSQVPSKFCHTHCEDSLSVYPVLSLMDHQYMSKKHSEETPLPDNDDDTVLVGCKKAGNINRFYDRTAGLFAVVRPCGIIVNFTEMFTCESATQAYVFLYTTFGRNLKDLARLRYLGYDRACGLHPFLKNLEAKGSLGAEILLSNVKFLVDLFHCKKHTELCCMPPDNPSCQYHPHLPAFAEIHGVNTECAEQAFKWLGRFKFHTRKMTRNRYCFFLWEMINLHNRRLTRQHT